MKSVSAQSESDDVSLAPVGCAGLDTVEVERVLVLELTAAAAKLSQSGAKPSQSRKPVVHILCTNATLHIEISEPQSRAQRTLDVPAPVEGEGRERTVALAASQLFVGSWLEMVEAAVKAEEPRPPQPKAPEKPPPASPPPPPRPHRVRYELGLGGVGTLRGRPTPMFLYGAGLHVSRISRIQASSWFVGLAARGERGHAFRQRGDVQARMLTLELDAGLRMQPAPWCVFDSQLQLAALVVQGEGVSRESTAVASSANGTAFQLGIGSGPSFGSGDLRLRALASAGYVFSHIRLRVDGEPNVELGGPAVSLSLSGTFGWQP